eukprot:TRINITY_DN65913_c0_g1_i1.p1 TRINITY_DN65913_c0_g1~~TRINITY_DN65913_c0_g1_i1.p1  ORF type:complete len:210 (+),score=42.93 TRINITY_DN65913_c0_g1_i1:81-710(+)
MTANLDGSPSLDFVTSSVGQQVAKDAAGKLAQSAADSAMRLLKMGAGEINVYVETNHYSVRMLSFCGGLFLAFVSFLGLLNIFAPLFGLLSYMLQFYQLCFGLIVCIIDGPLDKIPRAQAMIVQHAPILHTNLGRTVFYMFIACSEGTQSSWVHGLVGWYFFGIAIMLILVKLKSLQSGEVSTQPETFKEMQGDIKASDCSAGMADLSV